MVEAASPLKTIAPRQTAGWGIAFLALNAMIGAGIFGLPGKLDAALGGFAPWFLLGAGVAMMGIAACYADLASRFDRSGGPQLYVATAFGPFAGFQAGWMNWASRIAASAANSVVVGAYVAVFVPGLPKVVTASVALVLVTLLNLAALKRVVEVLGLMSVAKLIPLLLVAVAAFIAYGLPATGSLPQWSATEGVALVALYALVGFESATVPAGEVRDPHRSIPRALYGTIALVTAVYVVVQLGYAASGIGASETPLADLAQARLGTAGSLMIAATAAVSIIANLSSAFATMPRVTAAMAEQGELPRIFNRRLADGSPIASVLIYGAVALALAVTGTFIFLASMATLARLLVYALCVLAIPVLDRREGRPVRPIRGLVLPLAVLLFCVWASSQSGQSEWLMFAAFGITGTVFYGLAKFAVRHD